MGKNSKFKWSIAAFVVLSTVTLVTFQNCAKVKFTTPSDEKVLKEDPCANNSCIQIPDLCEENPSLPECQELVCEPRTITQDGCNQPANGISQKTCNDQGTEWGSCVISCNSGYIQDGETCKANACKGTVPTGAEKCAGDDVIVPLNTSWTYASSCTESKKCEYKCNASHNYQSGSCICKNGATDVGTCKQCSNGNELVNNICVPKCSASQTRNSSGVCVEKVTTRVEEIPVGTNSEDPLVKILLVIDNSQSMAQSQTQLSEKIDKLVSQLGDRNFDIGVVSIFDFKIEQASTYWINGLGGQQISKPSTEADFRKYINKEIIEYKDYVLDKSQTKIFRIQKGLTAEERNEIAQSIKNYVNPNCSITTQCLKTRTSTTSTEQNEQGLCVIKRQMEEAGIVASSGTSGNGSVSTGFLNEGDKLGIILISDENDSGASCHDYRYRTVTPKLLPSGNTAQYNIYRKAFNGKYAAPSKKYAIATDYKYKYTKWVAPVIVDGVETKAGYWQDNVDGKDTYNGKDETELPFTSWVSKAVCSTADAELVINRIKALNSGVKDFTFVGFSSYNCRYSSNADIPFSDIPSGVNYNQVTVTLKDWVEGQPCTSRDRAEIEAKKNWTLKECAYSKYQNSDNISFYGAYNYVPTNPSNVTCNTQFAIDENGSRKSYNNIFEYNTHWSSSDYIQSSCTVNFGLAPEYLQYNWGGWNSIDSSIGGDISASLKELARTKFNSSVHVSSIVHVSSQSGCIPQSGQSYGTKYIDLGKSQYFGAKAKASSICATDYSESILDLASSVLTPKNNIPLVLAANETIKKVVLFNPGVADGIELASSELSYANGVLTINSNKLVVGSRVVVTIQIN